MSGATKPCGHCQAPVDFFHGARYEIDRKTIYICSNACLKALKRQREGMEDPPHCNTCRCVAPVRKELRV